MQVNGSLSESTLALFGVKRPARAQAAVPDKAVSTAGQAVKGSTDLDFVYTAPDSGAGAASAADELARVVTRLEDATLRDLDEAARSRIGAELGRALGPEESYATLSTAERLSLSAETRDGARDLRLGRIAMALAMRNPREMAVKDLSDQLEAAG